VVTEGELDAMAAHQGTGIVAVSLPNGANSLPEAILEPLRHILKLLLWTDADKAGQTCAERLVKKLNHSRCFVVPPDAALNKDANDALRAGLDLNKVLEPLRHIPKLLLWTDADKAGQTCAERLVKKLNHSRCFVVPPDAALNKDANDALRAGLDLNKVLAAARQVG
jgi:DNA primase